MMAKLRVLNSQLSGKEFPLPAHPVIVGRSSGSDIIIFDQSISRQHVRVEVKDGHCQLTDLGSHNGIVIGTQTVREATLASGGRFELGDVVIEFILEEEHATADAAADAAPFAVPEGYALAPAAAAAPPSERPVLVDEVFGAAAAEAQPGAEEKAAVTGAWNTVQYVGLLAVIVVLGIIAWSLAGGKSPETNVKDVIVKAGERRVIDLGLTTRQIGSRLVPYVDENEFYSTALAGSPDPEIADVSVDETGFMATVEGIAPGETDARLSGPGGRTAILRIVVRGVVPRPAGEERLTNEQRVSLARQLIASGQAAQQAGRFYEAVTKFREAKKILGPDKDPDASAYARQANQLEAQADKVVDQKYDDIKLQVLIQLRERNRIRAAKALEELENLIPDPSDERNQEVRIIFNRIMRQVREGGG